MIHKKDAAILVAKGHTNAEVAQKLGVGPSYISQLVNDEKFQILVEQLKAVGELTDTRTEEEKAAEKERKDLHQVLDDTYDAIEEEALGKLVDRMSMGLITKTADILAVAKFANSANRKTNPGERVNQVPAGEQIVQVTISPVMQQSIQVVQTKVNERNEVIEVGDQTIVNKGKNHILEDLRNLEQKQKLAGGSVAITAEDLLATDKRIDL